MSIQKGYMCICACVRAYNIVYQYPFPRLKLNPFIVPVFGNSCVTMGMAFYSSARLVGIVIVTITCFPSCKKT